MTPIIQHCESLWQPEKGIQIKICVKMCARENEQDFYGESKREQNFFLHNKNYETRTHTYILRVSIN